jgi:hypothetical protein
MGRVFISYSRKDREPVDKIYQSMTKEGLDAWLDRQDIKAGSLWKKEIVMAIDSCPAFVLMLSPNSAASDNVRREIDLARDSERTILPLLLDPVNTPLPPLIRSQLENLQPIDAVKLGFQDAVGELIRSVRGQVEKLQALVEPALRKVEVVLKGESPQTFTPEKQSQLLDGLAPIAGAAPSQMTVTDLAPGSLHVFVEMPADAAYELKTQALNRDRRFKDLRVVSLRLAGNRQFINTSLGLLTATATLTLWQSLWLRTPALLARILGMTLGKVLTIALVVVLAAGVAVAAPSVGSLLAPVATLTPTPTAAPKPAASATSIPVTLTEPQAPSASPAVSLSPTGTPSPSLTPTASNPLMSRDAICWFGPGPDYGVVGALRKDTSVALVGPGAVDGWLVVVFPGTNAACWVQARDVQLDPSLNLGDMQSILPPPRPTLRVIRPKQTGTVVVPPTAETCVPPEGWTPDPYGGYCG